jgi:putative PIN family toxin of toxin-antitoxin system
VIVVLDTSILVSLLLSRGPTLTAIDKAWRERRIEILSCTELMDEARDVLMRPKFAVLISLERSQGLLERLAVATLPVSLNHPYPISPDPGDDFLLAMIRDGNAEALVTGDKALVSLQSFGGVPILSASAFAELLTR